MSFMIEPSGIVKPTLFEKFTYWRHDAKFIGMLKRAGWSHALPVYRWVCYKHGPVYSTPHGFAESLMCLECLKEMSI